MKGFKEGFNEGSTEGTSEGASVEMKVDSDISSSLRIRLFPVSATNKIPSDNAPQTPRGALSADDVPKNESNVKPAYPYPARVTIMLVETSNMNTIDKLLSTTYKLSVYASE